MNKFYLIQRGKINKKGGPSLTGRDGVVDLDYMGSAEFEFGAIPYSYRKIMHDFADFTITNTKVKVVGNRKLLLFAKKESGELITEAIRNFIDNPYQLKEWSELEKLVKVADINVPWSICWTRFWWCIDKGELGQWMAFLEEDSKRIIEALRYDHQNWWMAMPKEKRNKLYQEAIHSPF
ncbi:MAG: hypothetical protein IJ220_01990 [Clostridia bacterium]|nr:hypothetical protein [Clostridia bacterium]